MAVTLREVGERAGVSARTVSNVVHGYVHVSAETRERVQRAIDELRYRPHVIARSLREGRTGMIALALPEISAPYFAELADHVQRTAAERGVTLLIDQTGADRERELLVLEGYRSHVIDGLILSPMAITAEDLAAADLDTPAVLLGESVHHSGLVHVAVDNVAAAREATEHLLRLGCRRVAAVGVGVGTAQDGPAQGRMRGYLAAHDAAGVEVDPGLAVPTRGWSRAAGYEAVRALLASGTPVDGLFCFNDVLALGAVRAVVDHGLRVPDDLPVVGWDDIEEGAYAVPALTTVSPDKEAIARTAVDRLLAQVAGEDVAAAQVLCGYRLVVRESTARGRATGGGTRRPVTPG
jgi:DNA-binding LacI/PurR family transcriptional regulator